MKRMCIGMVLAAAGVASAAVPLIDFESEAERKAAPRLNRKTYRFGLTNLCATSGRNSFFLSVDKWKPGDYEWPAFTLTVPGRDWTSYDRLVFDVTNLGEGGDTLALRVGGPDGKVADLGLARSMVMPAWERKQWVVDLQYWPKEACATNITRLFLYTHRPRDMHAFIDRFTLLKPGEALPPAPKFDAASAAAIRAGREVYDAGLAARRKSFLDSLAKANAAAGVSPDGFLVGQASSMDGVKPKDTHVAKGPAGMSLRMARNEYEALQVLVTPTEGNLKGVTVGVSPLKLKVPVWKRLAKAVYLPLDAVKVSVMGYVETKDYPRY